MVQRKELAFGSVATGACCSVVAGAAGSSKAIESRNIEKGTEDIDENR